MKSLLKIFVLLAIVFIFRSVWAEEIPPPEKETKRETKYVSIKQSKLMAKTLFNNLWQELCEKFGERNLKFPKQVVFLNGAPGSGKGTNTLNVMRALEISTPPIEVSSLLTTPECEALKTQGQLVSDDIVITQVMNELLKAENSKGIIIDGFPRTIVQAYFLKYLLYKLHKFHDEMPIGFKIVKFSVTRQTSIERQLARGAEAIEQNKKAKESGSKVVAVRPTDLSFEAASRRYQIYEDSINACMAILQNDVLIYDINAEGTLEEVRRRVDNILSGQKKKR
ncbi:MAG: nucleoside monophosphate kinase [Puniceicoccales bacterium]|nr:nucleoside monophosphate kinase [Puniceicoccales bacterium]